MNYGNFESLLIQKLNFIEKEYPVEKIYFEDYYLWPIIKIKIYFEILINHNTGNKTHNSNSISKKNNLLCVFWTQVFDI